MSDDRFQVMPPLSADEEAALRFSIARLGVIDPVLIDSEGVILSGHHRAKIARDLGIDYPTRVIDLEDDEAKIAFAVTHELGRRHLDREQKRAVAKRLADEGLSLRKIAELTGIPRSTVGDLLNPRPKPDTERKLWELTDEEIDEAMERRRGGDGKTVTIPATPEAAGIVLEGNYVLVVLAAELARRWEWKLADAMVSELGPRPSDEDFWYVYEKGSEHSPEALRAMWQAARNWPPETRPPGRGIGAFCTGLPDEEMGRLCGGIRSDEEE